MYPPNDPATCALAKILWEFENPAWVEAQARKARKARPDWVRTPAQEAIRALSARMAP